MLRQAVTCLLIRDSFFKVVTSEMRQKPTMTAAGQLVFEAERIVSAKSLKPQRIWRIRKWKEAKRLEE